MINVPNFIYILIEWLCMELCVFVHFNFHNIEYKLLLFSQLKKSNIYIFQIHKSKRITLVLTSNIIGWMLLHARQINPPQTTHIIIYIYIDVVYFSILSQWEIPCFASTVNSCLYMYKVILVICYWANDPFIKFPISQKKMYIRYFNNTMSDNLFFCRQFILLDVTILYCYYKWQKN